MSHRTDPHVELARLDAIEAATWPPRIQRAIEILTQARSPLRARDHSTESGGGTMESKALAETSEMQRAKRQRAELQRAITDRNRLARTIATILDEWAPLSVKGGMGDTENAALWCPNHLKHGKREPASTDRSRHCRWCCDVHRSYSKYPTAELVEMHHAGRRISDAEYRRLLGKGNAA